MKTDQNKQRTIKNKRRRKMKLYEWEFKLFEKDGICQVNMKLSTTIKSKDYMKLQDGITQLVQKYKVENEK